MKQKRLIALLLAGSMIATTALTGCGGSKREGSDGKAATEESAGEETAGKDPVTLWMHNGPAFVDATKEMAEDFKKETGITVEVQTFPYDVMSQKMKTAYAAGNEPDIIQAFGSWLPTYVNQGAFAAVPDDFAAKFDEEFYEGAVEGLKKNGKYYGVPIEMQCEYGLFYVPEKVKEAYVEDGKPDTFKEVVQVGKSTAKFNGDILEYGGLEFDNGDNVAQMFLSWILQSGGTFWDEEGTHLSLQSEEAKKAWQRMVDLVTVDKVTDTKHASGDVTTDNFFFNKKGAQLVKGAWASCYGDEFKNDNWEYTFFPAFEGDTPKFVVETGWAYVVSEKSKNKDNAFKFVEYCLQPANAKAFAETTVTIPPIRSVAEDPAFTGSEANKRFADQFQYLQYAQNVGPVQDMDYVKKVVRETFHSQVDGKYTTEEALKFMEEDINKHIDVLLAQAK